MITQGASGEIAAVGLNAGKVYPLSLSTTTTLASTSTLTLPSSASKYLKLSIAGGSKQDSTTGAQLIDMAMDNWEQGGLNGSTGIDEMNQNATRLRIKAGNMISVKPGTTYTISRYNLDYCVALRFYRTDREFAGETQGGKKVNGWVLPPKENTLSFTVTTNDNVAYARVLVGKGDSTQNVSLSDLNNIKMQLQEGSVYKPWELYTGGKTSPSIEYSHEIKSSGKRTSNLEDITMEVGDIVLATGLDGVSPNRSRCIEYLNVIPGKTYTISVECNKAVQYGIRWYKADQTFIEPEQTSVKAPINGVYSASVTAPDDAAKMRFIITTPYGNIGKAWINAGDTATTYEPYGYKVDIRITDEAGQLQTASIYDKEPFRGIGGRKDIISKKGGIWGVERKTIEYTFDGAENWTIGDFFGYKIAAISVSKSNMQYNTENLRCSHAKTLAWSNTGVVCFVDNYTIFRFGGMGVEQVQTLAAWKSWLADQASKGTPLTIIYTLATPAWEPLNDATQATLNALAAYKGTTIITVDSGEVGTTITATYKKKGR